MKILRMIVCSLALLAIGIHQMIERWGTFGVVFPALILAFLLVCYVLALYKYREKVKNFLAKLFTFSFSREEIFSAEDEKEKSIFTTHRKTSDKVAITLRKVLILVVSLCAIMLLLIVLFDKQNDIRSTIKFAMSICVVLIILLQTFRKRNIWRTKAHRFFRKFRS